MPKQYSTIIDEYLGRFSKSKDEREKELADIARKRREKIDTASIYRDDPRSFVLAVVESIYKSLGEKNVDSMLHYPKKGKKKIVESCKRDLNRIVSKKLKFDRTDVDYEELVSDALELDRLCNSFYRKASQLMELEEQDSFMEYVMKLHRPAARIIRNLTSDGTDNIDKAVDELLDRYKINDPSYCSELEWAQANRPEKAKEMEMAMHSMLLLQSEVQSPISDRKKLEKLVQMDKLHRSFHRLRADVRKEIISKVERSDRDDGWRDVL
ncbi:MAG: hypothetical protein QXU82_02525 [Candidatus Aenigmatarchaeota archaeon]